MSESSTPSDRRRWPRFSLLNALLMMPILGLVIVVAQLWREVGPLREEVRRLRDEVGYLAVEDPAKVSAIRVDTRDELTWKWRVWIPEGRTYHLNYASSNIPKSGSPTSNGMIVIEEPGEMWIQYQIDPVSTSDMLSTSNGSVGTSAQPWVKWERQISTTEGVGSSTEAFEPNANVNLVRHRVTEKQTSSDKIEDPAAGFMIWLEPQ